MGAFRTGVEATEMSAGTTATEGMTTAAQSRTCPRPPAVCATGAHRARADGGLTKAEEVSPGRTGAAVAVAVAVAGASGTLVTAAATAAAAA
eukprot:COSAG01_NODE_34225_length_551_cov_0.871681_1_plen_91_part_10